MSSFATSPLGIMRQRVVHRRLVDVAQSIKVSPTMLARLERGECVWDETTGKRLATLYGTTLEVVLTLYCQARRHRIQDWSADVRDLEKRVSQDLQSAAS